MKINIFSMILLRLTRYDVNTYLTRVGLPELYYRYIEISMYSDVDIERYRYLLINS